MQNTRKNTRRLYSGLLARGLVFGLLSSALLAGGVSAGESQARNQQRDTVLSDTLAIEKRVHSLLDTAVEHIQKNGITGVNDFNSDPGFTDNELYLFSLSRGGVLLSSGGWSAALIGQNVLDLTDEEGHPFFKQMLDSAKTANEGKVEYLWFNPADAGADSKISYFRVVDNIVIAAGYFPGFSTEESAKDLLDVAVSEYFKNPVLALRKFRNKQSGFRNPDQYVFVLDKAERTVLWTPVTPSLNDQPLDHVTDIQGKPFLAEILDTASPNNIQQIDYQWFSPVTKRVESRRAFYQQVGDSVLAVGTFVLSGTNGS
ncbi:cache domain-containing protein [Paenalcaligenes niemegkensis]|uniref:cache domain-containing protein n=1 Tax=Paenalcaligenes niemegkensis TaxID=2895469 RepID=UPI001EE951E2|nr:cache domain-containing protein [Paenalcaligenes niemegkensis]MCQ9615709.1 cache domain-containing protein [Paenalcaligenes niemegkensis]